MEETVLGRSREKEVLQRLLDSPRPEFLAIYGRRRIGKTFLINEYFEDKALLLEIVGAVDSPRDIQLARFAVELANKFPWIPKDVTFEDWDQALQALVEAIDRLTSLQPARKIVRGPLEISAALRRSLEHKKELFRKQTHTRSLLLTTLVTADGVKPGKHYHGVVDQQLTMDCLFLPKR